MKKLICCIVISLFLLDCAQEKKSPVEGAWKLVYMQSYSGDSLVYDLNTNFKGSDMKIWSGTHFAFVGKFQKDTITMDNYGGGTFKLDGKNYQETILYHRHTPSVGNIYKFFLEIKNDTLIQTGFVNDQGQINKSNHSIEKYVRLN